MSQPPNLAAIQDDIEAEAERIRDEALARVPGFAPKPYGTQLVCGTDVTPEAITWLWDGWLAAGKLHLIAGQAGTGKTTLALSMAATITKAGKWPDGSQAGSGCVLMWSGEDGLADSLLPRFLASGGDPKRLHFINGFADTEGDRNFDPATDVHDLISKLESISDLRLIIVDPIVAAVAGDSHKNAEVRRGLQPLVDMAARVGAAILGVTHFTKGSKGADPTERVTGSLAFGALARLVMCTAKPAEEGTSRRLVRSKSNIGPDGCGFEYELQMVPLSDGIEGQSVVWGNPIDGTAHKLLGEIESVDEGGSEHESATIWLHQLLKNGAMKSKDVEKHARASGFARRTVQRAAKDCPDISIKREGFGRGSCMMWSLICATNMHMRQPESMAHMGNDGAYEDVSPWEVEV